MFDLRKIAALAQGQRLISGVDPLTRLQPTFMRMFVIEVISDPQSITDEKIAYWENVLGIANSQTSVYSKVLPRNTIIGQRMLDGSKIHTPPMFLLPFFPSHLALPCKPGELVWAAYEHPHAALREIGYWFCKITEPHFVDDVNHTHTGDQLDPGLFRSVLDRAQEKQSDPKELRNGLIKKDENGLRLVDQQSLLINSDKDDVFEKLITQTDAAGLMQYEPVPRFTKRPGDVVLEGSNNALIVLGTDRTGPIASYMSGTRGFEPSIPETDTKGFAGSIDIVAGRGTVEYTGGAVRSTTKILDGQELKKEIDKIDVRLDEGNPDFFNDRSRILVSQKTKPDFNFYLSDYMDATHSSEDSPEATVKDSPGGDAAIVIKSDKVRIIARSDISFVVTNWEPNVNNQTGATFKSDDLDQTKWASITIKRNGDIVFTPSSKGYIKLGSDFADKAILCTDLPAVAAEGKVTFPDGILTSGADVVGIGKKKGTFASKILVSTE